MSLLCVPDGNLSINGQLKTKLRINTFEAMANYEIFEKDIDNGLTSKNAIEIHWNIGTT